MEELVKVQSDAEHILYSQLDDSINWVKETEIGFFESRYVRREDNYFVVYLSSQSGCNQSCRMCHLTASGQVSFEDANPVEILRQANQALMYYKNNARNSKVVHFNFMARGEPLNNQYLLKDSDQILGSLAQSARDLELNPKYLISTIMPKTLENVELVDLFPVYHPEIYYSLYSTSASFRKRWLPKALTPDHALKKLYNWQRHASKIPKVHFAFIENENDSQEDVLGICKAIKQARLRVNFNIVRYNPPKHKLNSKESSEPIIKRNIEIIESEFPDSRIKLHPRVGFDVKASCGMFVNP